MKGVVNYKQRITEQATNVGCKSGYIIINKNRSIKQRFHCFQTGLHSSNPVSLLFVRNAQTKSIILYPQHIVDSRQKIKI